MRKNTLTWVASFDVGAVTCEVFISKPVLHIFIRALVLHKCTCVAYIHKGRLYISKSFHLLPQATCPHLI